MILPDFNIFRWRRASSDREEQREGDQRKEGNEEQQKEEPKTEKINLNQNFCHHSPIEAFGWVRGVTDSFTCIGNYFHVNY